MVIPQPSSQPLRTRIYVDGYNFYYGCLKSTPFKWLDLLALFETQVLPGIQAPPPWAGRPFELTPRPALKYFTAKILEQAAKATDSVSSQARYHTALRKVHGDRLERVDGKDW